MKELSVDVVAQLNYLQLKDSNKLNQYHPDGKRNNDNAIILTMNGVDKVINNSSRITEDCIKSTGVLNYDFFVNHFNVEVNNDVATCYLEMAKLPFTDCIVIMSSATNASIYSTLDSKQIKISCSKDNPIHFNISSVGNRIINF